MLPLALLLLSFFHREEVETQCTSLSQCVAKMCPLESNKPKEYNFRMAQQFHVHTHASGAFGFFSNAHIVETDNGVVVVDATFTRSESRAVRTLVESLGKPFLAVLITHPHPDHIAGLTELVGQSGVSIVALASVAQTMHQREAYVQSVAPQRFVSIMEMNGPVLSLIPLNFYRIATQ